MPTQINGLPAHVLLIHAVVILVPTASLLLVGQAWIPRVRRWAGVLGPLLSLGALVMVPITTQAGEWLRDHLPKELAESAQVRKHAELGDDLLLWVVGLFVLSVVVFLLGRRPTAPALNMAVAVIATVIAVGSIVQTVRIGDSGAQAVWKGSVVTR